MSEAYGGGMALEVKPLHQYTIISCIVFGVTYTSQSQEYSKNLMSLFPTLKKNDFLTVSFSTADVLRKNEIFFIFIFILFLACFLNST